MHVYQDKDGGPGFWTDLTVRVTMLSDWLLDMKN